MTETAKQAARRLSAPMLDKGFKPVALHEYTDDHGEPIYYRMRAKHPDTGEKWIRPMYRNGNGYEIGEPKLGHGKPLYRLHDLIKRRGDPVWFVEGENCADALAKIGMLATTAGSAQSDERADFGPLAGRRVTIWPDNDDAGREHADRVAAKLRALSCNVEVIDTAALGLRPKDDCVDWLEAHQDGTPDDIARLSRIQSAPTDGINENWPQPIPFDTLRTPEIDPALLPGAVGGYVAALANHTETPAALGVMIALGVIATATKGRLFIELDAGHRETANLYTLIALPPGNRKSSVLSALTAPLIKWERNQAEQLKPEVARSRSKRRSEEALIEQRRRKLHCISNELERDQEILNIASAEEQLTRVSVIPRLFANDTTPEALATALDEQSGVFALLSDEGGIADVLSGLYTNGNANIDVFLKGWDGGALRIRRKDRDIDLNPLLTVALAVQPAVLGNIAAKRAFRGRGVVERFLFALPISTLGTRTHDKQPPSSTVIDAYGALVGSILDDPRTRTLNLSAEARREWRDFQGYIESMMAPGGKLSDAGGWAGKLPGQILRVAGLLHVTDQSRNTEDTITANTMNAALELGALLIDHAIAAFAEMGIDQADADARRCWRWIEGRASFTKGELTLQMRHTMNAERITKALQALSDRNLIDTPIGTPSKPGTRERVFNVHPAAGSAI